MPRFRPSTLIIELEHLSTSELVILLSELASRGVVEVFVVTAPSIAEVSLNNQVCAVAIAPFTLLVVSSETGLPGIPGLRAYRMQRDAWIDSVKVNTQLLIDLVRALLAGDQEALSKYNVVLENPVDCKDVVFSFPLTVKAVTHSTRGEFSLTKAYSLYRELLREQRILLAVCSEGTGLLPYAWIERRGDKTVLVLRKPINPVEEKIALKILLDYVAAESLKTMEKYSEYFTS